MKTNRALTSLVLHMAWEYFDMGFHLIPLAGKKPAGDLLPQVDGRPSWKPFLQRRNSEEEIRRWFTSRDTNIGLLTGISGVVVVDCDNREEANWWQKHRPRTRMVSRTARGFHFFYQVERHDIALGNRTGVLGRKIDLRAFGGYVVIPPSRHPSGTQYEWIGSWCLDEVPRFDPAWIKPAQHTPLPDTMIADAERLRRYIFHIQSISGQRGHNACFRCACKIADAGVSFDTGMRIFREWNQVCATPPWSERELHHKLVDAFNRTR